jgi:hypothetical protein
LPHQHGTVRVRVSLAALQEYHRPRAVWQVGFLGKLGSQALANILM